jgi:hypothetical protein
MAGATSAAKKKREVDLNAVDWDEHKEVIFRTIAEQQLEMRRNLNSRALAPIGRPSPVQLGPIPPILRKGDYQS